MKNSHRFLMAASLAACVTWSSLGAPARAKTAQRSRTTPGHRPDQFRHGAASAVAIGRSQQHTHAGRSTRRADGSRYPGSLRPAMLPAATTGIAGQQTPMPQTRRLHRTSRRHQGPIGSFGQTIPAKFSKRNDILDHVPIMALPLRLTDEQRKQIYDAVMADKSQPVAGADALKPTSELSPDQALNGMRPLPESVRGHRWGHRALLSSRRKTRRC